MSYSADVFNVMIASPNDVGSERSIIRDVIYEWNAVHSKAREIVLLPVGWESHSAPEMGTPAQKIINKQVLSKCDLLVGVFWTRIGTPTQDYASGTVEEIEEHIASKKPTMLYFSSQPVTLDSVDAEQYAELKAFKESCKGRGLFQDYDSHSDFKDKFYRQLQIKTNEDEIFLQKSPGVISEIHSSKTYLPPLSHEARLLLKQASLDPNGHILSLRYIGGAEISTNGKKMLPSQERRDLAKWEAAIQELLIHELLIERGTKGEIFELTNLGYQIADMIEL